jgi:starch phosphorylase
MSGTEFILEIQAEVPRTLQQLKTFANDLYYSWNQQVRGLFYRLDPHLWEQCNHSPKIFLRRISQQKLQAAANDAAYIKDYKRIVEQYEHYISSRTQKNTGSGLDPHTDQVVYFSAEFGLHESLPIYSGGLGILAGDHCKAASDLGLPFTAVGLLYHEGYFLQTIDSEGHQVAEYKTHHFKDLPIEPVCKQDGGRLLVTVEIQNRTIHLCLWRTRVGHIDLYLLDSDVEQNSKQDRSITHRLYGGDQATRIQQEIVLGIGGVRALRALKLAPNVWHINEGHSAFQLLERIREYMEQGMTYPVALELTAASTVFTTHTPVPAGHDIFERELLEDYLGTYIKQSGIKPETLLRLGHTDSNHGRFNMTALALRCSRLHNGVSRIHGTVASQMEAHLWPDIAPAENPIGYVTNGVHVPTFLDRQWVELFDAQLRNWRNELRNPGFWASIDTIKDESYWNVRKTLRADMLQSVCARVIRRCRRNGCSEHEIRKTTRYMSAPQQDVLVLGFARRFATYKRATLLFADENRLKRLLNNPKQPVILIFAGKAHPKDEPGQQLIKTIHDYSRHPDFIGKIILLENYDLSLAKKLVTGVDVWINTPEYPLEACGTSGQKAGINGVLNLSVADGWWGEAYNGHNGWVIVPHTHANSALRYQEEAADLLDILEHDVIPSYFERDQTAYSSKWVRMSKESMKTIIPHFNSQRMVMDYVNDYYRKAAQHSRKIAARAQEMADWKDKIRSEWKNVALQLVDSLPTAMPYKSVLELRVHAALGQLSPQDLRIELLLNNPDNATAQKSAELQENHLFSFESSTDGKAVFRISLPMEHCGLHHLKIRAYPYHELLMHPLEMGYMKWL